MDTIQSFVQVLNKEEIRFFKIFSYRQTTNSDRKDFALLDWFRKRKEHEHEEEFIAKNYGLDNKNAYYRLKNRLLEELSHSLVIQHHDKEELLKLLNLIGLVRIFFRKQAYRLALHYLKKAEKRAHHLEQFELLDFIYAEYIKLSHELLEINPAEIIDKRKDNSRKLNQIREMDDLLALLSYQLKVSQNFNVAANVLMKEIELIVEKQENSEDLRKSSKFQIKLYGLVSQMYLQKHDYKNLEAFTEKTYQTFISDGIFNKENHDTKLQMITYISNAAFKNKNIVKSLKYAELLRLSMDEYDGVLKSKYEVFYVNALVNNYMLSNIEKAIGLLENLLNEKKFAQLPFYELFLQINLATCYFEKKLFQKASRQITRTMIADAFKNADPQLQLKVNMAELIIRSELQDYEFLLHRIEQVRKTFKSILPDLPKEKTLLELLWQSGKNGSGPEHSRTKNIALNFVNQYAAEDQENELIRYTDWLREKLKLQ
ncbi:MAG: hypothetical protein ACK4GL_12580 [Flavobacteriales bacterium]